MKSAELKRRFEHLLRDEAGFTRAASKYATSLAARVFLDGTTFQNEHSTMSNDDQILEAIEASKKAFAEYRAAAEARMTALERFEAKATGRPGNGGHESGGAIVLNRGGRRVEGFDRSNKDVKRFNDFFRSGSDGEFKSMSDGSGPDGGFGVPTVIDSAMEQILFQSNPLRAVFKIVPVTTTRYHKLVNTLGWTSTWVAETAARPPTSNAQLVDLQPNAAELYANPQASQWMMDDFQFDAATWIVDQCGQSIAEQEAIGFLLGTGANQPQGLLTIATATTGDAARPFGTAQYFPSGAAATLAPTNALDVFQNMLYSMRPGYRQQDCVWLMNPLTLSTIATLKDTLGRFLVQPSVMVGQPQTLLGKAIIECESMPVIAANAIAVVLINGQRAYEIVDRYGIRVLRDPFSNKPFCGFYTTKRVSGFVVNTQAVKFLKISVA